ncbi:CRISPR-associated endonuclease Cas1 [Pelistega suis]|uniref:CRISPR-associated endonuclease Cas1 n=1 Tax=Pelistega suis TaxID=1631957 RepID=UPI00211CB94A|nr:CRISPR-associated endonuclease Cas1 [Pelistega suis]MCQ9328412.1 CRISPR-associated endonuclease Cas1 [Pelistega suis]
MSTLFIEQKGLSLDVKYNALVFYGVDGKKYTSIPLKMLERVCMRGDLQLSARVLGKLGEAGVGIVILSGRQKQPTLLMPSLKVDALRRKYQFLSSLDELHSVSLVRNLIQQKIQGQVVCLDEFLQKYPQKRLLIYRAKQSLNRALVNLPSIQNIDKLRGLEGAAAAKYFSVWVQCLPEVLRFLGRRKHPCTDPVNATLSLAYTLVYGELVREIYLMGLDPYVGFLHTIEHGRASLACDLIEPLRPQIDWWVLSLFAHRLLRVENFSYQSEVCQLGKTARIQFYSAYEEFAVALRQEIRSLCRQFLKSLGELHQEMMSFQYEVREI